LPSSAPPHSRACPTDCIRRQSRASSPTGRREKPGVPIPRARSPRLPTNATIAPMTEPAGSFVAPPVERHIEVAPGVALHVEQRSGDRAAAPFVLVHGLASNVRLWDGVAEHLHALGHTVIAIDQRGHGRSDAPASGYDLDTAVADLLALIGALELERPVLAGQSWGGNVVLELAWRHPEAVRGIACVDGGVIELSQSYPSLEECLSKLTPPTLDHLPQHDLYVEFHGRVGELLAGAVSEGFFA